MENYDEIKASVDVQVESIVNLSTGRKKEAGTVNLHEAVVYVDQKCHSKYREDDIDNAMLNRAIHDRCVCVCEREREREREIEWERESREFSRRKGSSVCGP